MAELLGNEGALFVVSAPAGTGKTTLVKMLMDEFPQVKESVSCTTRSPRGSEVAGTHYHFLSQEEFEQKIDEGDLLEYAEVFGNLYGTSRIIVQQMLHQGLRVILVIDTQGAMKLKKSCPEATFIFIKPPSMDELRRRLVDRRTEAPELIEERLSWAKRELKAAENYDYILINQDLSVAYQVLRSIIIAEAHRSHRVKISSGLREDKEKSQ